MTQDPTLAGRSSDKVAELERKLADAAELSAWLWVGIIATLVVEVTVVYLAVISVLDLWVNR